MRHGNTAGFLGVIIEVSLCVHIGVVADDLDGVLGGTYGTVGTQTPELTVCGSFWCGNKRSTYRQGQVGNIIYDTDGELFLGCILIDSNDLSRCSIFGTKSVTTCEDRSLIEFCYPLMLLLRQDKEARQGNLALWFGLSTVICLTVSGIASTSALATNGRYRRTFTTPTFFPAATR